MLCYHCLSDNKEVEAVALAGRNYSGRTPDSPVYEFVPICDYHLCTWNDGASEIFPCYDIHLLQYEMGLEASITKLRLLAKERDLRKR